MAYGTPEDLASYLQQDLDRASAELALDTAAASIRRVTRSWRFDAVAEVTTVYPGDVEVIHLQRPVTAVAAVTTRGAGVTVARTVDEDYELVDHGLVWTGSWGRWPGLVSVTYSRGMAAAPEEIVDAERRIAALRYMNPGQYDRQALDDWRGEHSTNPEQLILAEVRRAYPPHVLSLGIRR